MRIQVMQDREGYSRVELRDGMQGIVLAASTPKPDDAIHAAVRVLDNLKLELLSQIGEKK